MGAAPKALDPLPRRADVIVVGGGVVGLCVAHYLTESGREVVLIDRAGFGDGASFGNAGLVAPSHAIPFPAVGAIRDGLRWLFDGQSPFYVRPSFDLERLGWLMRFALASGRRRSEAGAAVLSELLLASAASFREDFAGRGDLNFAYHSDGVLAIHATPQSLERGLAEGRLLERFGIASQPLDGAELSALEPTLSPALAGAMLWPQDGHLDPYLLISQLVGSLARRGVRFEWSTEVLSFSLDRGRVGSLRTTAGEIEPTELVLAAGAWSPGLSRQLGLRLPMQAGKGYSITAATGEEVPRRPLLFADARVVATPLRGRLRLAGTLELVGHDMGISRRRVDAIRAVGESFLAGVKMDPQARIWRGLRPLTADGLPVIGRPRGLSNVVIATGHGHLGVSLGPVTGRIVSELAAGGGWPTDLSAVSPDRF